MVGEASDGEEAITSAAKLQPAVIVMDINMPKMDGITTTRLIKAQNPEIVVVGISSGLKDYQVHAMQKAGAFEVLNKDLAVTDLYSAIQRGVAAVKPVLILDEPSSKKKSTEELEQAVKPSLCQQARRTGDSSAELLDRRFGGSAIVGLWSRP